MNHTLVAFSPLLVFGFWNANFLKTICSENKGIRLKILQPFWWTTSLQFPFDFFWWNAMELQVIWFCQCAAFISCRQVRHVAPIFVFSLLSTCAFFCVVQWPRLVVYYAAFTFPYLICCPYGMVWFNHAFLWLKSRNNTKQQEEVQ